MCLHYVCAHAYVWMSEKDMLLQNSFMELELQAVVSHRVGTGTEPRSSGKAANTLNCGAISPALLVSYV